MKLGIQGGDTQKVAWIRFYDLDRRYIPGMDLAYNNITDAEEDYSAIQGPDTGINWSQVSSFALCDTRGPRCEFMVRT